MSNFNQFNIDVAQYQADLEAMAEQSKPKEETKREFKDAPDGQYECMMRSLELGTNRAGNKLMLKGAFKIINNTEGYGNLFLNKVLTGTKNDSWCVKSAVDFLNSLGSVQQVEFTGDFDDLAKQVEIVFADIQQCTFVVEQVTTDSGFKNLYVRDVFDN